MIFLVKHSSDVFKLLPFLKGRSLVFASWDGEEFGELGSTSWLYRHSKEVSSRGVAYINMDYLLQGADDIHVPSSPLLREALWVAAKAVACTGEEASNMTMAENLPCMLFDRLLERFSLTENNTGPHPQQQQQVCHHSHKMIFGFIMT